VRWFGTELTTRFGRRNLGCVPAGFDPEDFPFSSFHEMCIVCRLTSVLGPCDRVTADCSNPRCKVVSTQRATPQVDQVPHAEVFGDLPELNATGRNETAQQTIAIAEQAK
jgi:hypothetical protein